MIFGETYCQRSERRALWTVKFAWFPKRMNDGRTVWLGLYQERTFWDKTKFGLLGMGDLVTDRIPIE